MKINRPEENSSRVKETPDFDLGDITSMYAEFQETHRNVFMQKFEGQVFFYRSLGRSEYRDILKDERFSDLEKEELICQVCTLWPEEFDFEDCDAGIPTELTKAILKNSFLDTAKARRNVLEHYRAEMFDLDNQITCIINEAFPQFDIEEIEEWDIEKTTKYLSRAEWKLHNLRGLEFYEAQTEGTSYDREEEQEHSPITEELTVDEPKTNHRGGNKEKMTPEKLREMQAKFPEINWAADVIMNEGIEGMKESVDVTSPALRPGF